MKMSRWFSSLPLRMRTLFKKRATEMELDEEIRFHLERQVDALMEQGFSPETARKIAMKEMGNVERQMEQCREVRAWQWLEILRADVRFGWRQLMKRKVTTATAVLSLALGIGSWVAAFRLVDALFLRPMPVSDPASLYVATYTRQPTEYLPGFFEANSYPFFEDARDVARGEAEVAAASTMNHIDLTYGSDAETEKVYRQWVSGELFSMLGLKPVMGRLLAEDDDRVVGKSPYAVISYDYWQRRFGRDPKVVGRTFRMGDNVYEIVGVAPKGFTGTEPGSITDIFAPAKMDPYVLRRDLFHLRIFVRPKAGVNVKILADKMNAAYQQWETERMKAFPKDVAAMYPKATLELKAAGTGASDMQSEYGSALTVLGVLVGLVLLIACANVANLMAAQAAARTREMALRMSLGSGRARLVRMVMVESAMLALMAAALGMAFAWWATPYVVNRINPPDDPARLALSADWMVVGFGTALALGVTVLFGMLPALRASAVRPVSALKGGEEPRSKTKWMQAMIAAQVAFCFVVLFLAGLFAMTEAKLTRRPMGFVAERLLLLDTTTQAPQPPVKWDQMAARLRNVPGVEATALENWPLLSGAQHNDRVSVKGSPPSEVLAFFLEVSPGWLDTMRIGTVDGRDFRENDTEPSVVIVNEAFAKQYFSGRSPVGQSFDTRPAFGPSVHYEIVGLVKDVRYRYVREQVLPQVYVPLHHAAATAGSAAGALQPMRDATIVVRTSNDDPMQIAEVLPRTVTQTDPEFRVSTVTTQTQLIETQTIRERLLARLAEFFGAVALLLAAIGLYGVLSYSVVQRERELGVRIALGAAAANIARLVTVRVMAMVMLGAIVGVFLGLVSVRYVESLLYGVKGTDVSMLVMPCAVLLGAALLAALPAVLRAVQIDPAVMLRAD
jgi:putative ABC transport system permease protein